MSAITAKASRKMKKYAVLTREPRCFLGSFDFSWEQRKLGEIGSVSMCRRIFKEQTSETGDIPFYKIGTFGAEPDAFISRELFEEYKSKYPYPKKGDILISASGSIGRTVEFAGNNEYFQDSNIVWLSHDERLSNSFLKCFYSVVKWAGIEGSTIKRLYNDNILNTVICMPSVPEQEHIGLFFENLDNLITLHQRKCALLFSPFQALISMMFTTSTFSWEQRKFGEVFDCTVPNNTLSRAELSYDEGTVLNVHYGDVLIKYGSVLDVQKDDIPRIPHRCREDFNGALLQDGDIIIADTAEDETTGKACEISNLQGSVIVSGLHTMVCRPRNRMALGYLGYYLNSNAYHHQLLPLMQGIKVLSLSRSNIQKTSVSYPTAVKEQQHIAYYFSQLDNLITLHQRKCISFTGRAGRLISTVNKKRITSSWEQRKLSELTSMHARIGWQNLRTSEFLDSGNYMLITGTDFNDGAINFSTCHYVERERYEQDRNIQIHNGSILITKDGTLGKVAYVQGLSMPATLNAGVFNVQIKDANNVDEKYLFQYLKAPFLMDYVDKKATGGTIKHLNQSILVDFPVILPQRSEQTLIGAFFQQLDNLITLHQRKPFLMKWRNSDANRNQTNRLVL